jgi:CDI immunity proteins
VEKSISVADILGPWIDPQWDSGLVNRCKNAWNKPLQSLTNEELATFLRQRFAVEHILPIAEKRLKDGVDDDSEMYEGELRAAIEYVGGRP